MSNHFLTTLLPFLFSIMPMADVAEMGSHPVFPYDLDRPDVVFELPDRLKEISGLSLSADTENLIAVNDEEGVVFLINKKTGAVVKEVKFWDEGDYEGLEVVGNDAYVIKSSGTLYQIKDFLSDDPLTVKIKTYLNKDNDVEGLAYNPTNNCLLVGCKGKIYEGEDPESAFKKAIYEFDLNIMDMKVGPAYMLTLPDIKDYISHIEEHGEMEELLEEFSDKEDELKFSPSGIAIHPISGEIYVTSSKGKMLLVLDRNGKIAHLKKLKKKIHAQPEGICFDADGTLYIANEGKDDKAVIYKFLYRSN